LDMGRIVQNSDVLLGIITQQVRSKRIWQIGIWSVKIILKELTRQK
jgi:hypothetical protein